MPKRTTKKPDAPHSKRMKTKPKTTQQTTDIALPSEPNRPSESITDYSFCFYGEKGIGKTTLAASFPDVIAHFNFEPSRHDLRVPLIPDPNRNEVPLTWQRFKDYCKHILDTSEPGRIVIDTIDGVANLCAKHHAAKRNVKSIYGLNDHGRAWDELKSDWYPVFNNLLFAGFRITFTSHSKKRPKVVRGYTREEIAELTRADIIPEETQPSCSGWAFDYLKIPVSYAFYYGWYGPQRVLHIRGAEDMWAASAQETHFCQPETEDVFPGRPIDMLPIDHDPRTVFDTLSQSWENNIPGFFNTEPEEEEVAPLDL